MVENKKGMSVIELLIAVAVLGILFSIILPQFSKIRENQVLKAATSNILSSLNKAQSQTFASINSSSYGVHFQSDKVIIFKGAVYSATDANNEIMEIIEPARISNVTLSGISGTSGNVYFNRLSGTPNTTGTITVATSSYSKIITISATGVATVN